MAVVGDDLKKVMQPTVENMVYLEFQMDELRKLPFIKINPNNPQMQKATVAAKMFKEFYQQYLNAVKVVERVAKSDEKAEISPLREWIINKLK